MKSRPLVLITGANGFLGAALVQKFKSLGWNVRALVRRPRLPDEYFYSLEEGWDERAFSFSGDEDRLLLIHCAHELNSAKKEQINFAGTMKLYNYIHDLGSIHFAYISSLAAHEEAHSSYGRVKAKIEHNLDLEKCLIIKPGTIIGPGGLFLKLATLIKKSPIIPVFYSNKYLQVIGLDDLCSRIGTLCADRQTGVFPVLHPEKVRISEFHALLAKKLHLSRLFIPVAGDLVIPVLKLMEKLSLSPPVSSDNLLGLKYIKYFEPAGLPNWQPQNYAGMLDKLTEL